MEVTRRLLAGLVLALVAALLPVAAVASPAEEGTFVSLINQSRSSAGLAPLTVASELVGYARSHTDQMIAAGKIFHSSNAQLAGASSGWSALGENVGMGPDPQVLHNAFMGSPSHRANILGNYNYVGVGAAHAPDGTLFVTVIFMLKETAPATTTTALPTTTTTAPPATTTTVAASPTTTTPAATVAAPATTTTTLPEGAAASQPTAVGAELRSLGKYGGELAASPARHFRHLWVPRTVGLLR